jgi:hypothetical protein
VIVEKITHIYEDDYAYIVRPNADTEGEEEIVARGNRSQAEEARSEGKVISRTGTGYGSYRKPQ